MELSMNLGFNESQHMGVTGGIDTMEIARQKSLKSLNEFSQSIDDSQNELDMGHSQINAATLQSVNLDLEKNIDINESVIKNHDTSSISEMSQISLNPSKAHYKLGNENLLVNSDGSSENELRKSSSLKVMNPGLTQSRIMQDEHSFNSPEDQKSF